MTGGASGTMPGKGNGLDERLFVALRTRAHPRFLETVIASLSVTGNWGIFWIGTGAALWATDAIGGLRDFIYLLAVVYVTLVVNFIIKTVLGRERPAPSDPALGPLVGTPSSKSFPSSHAAMSFAAACTLTWLYTPLWPLYFAVAFLMSWSRVYTGVHYPSDVL
ncbi:MAG: phosphatase PAP2 family protein, partial [Actinomycetota bacterium]